MVSLGVCRTPHVLSLILMDNIMFQHVDEDMISAANSEDGMPPGRPDPAKVRAR